MRPGLLGQITLYTREGFEPESKRPQPAPLTRPPLNQRPARPHHQDKNRTRNQSRNRERPTPTTTSTAGIRSPTTTTTTTMALEQALEMGLDPSPAIAGNRPIYQAVCFQKPPDHEARAGRCPERCPKPTGKGLRRTSSIRPRSETGPGLKKRGGGGHARPVAAHHDRFLPPT